MQVCVVAKDMKRTRGLPATTVKKTPVQCRAHFVKQKAALRSAAKALAEAQAAYEQKQQKREEHFQMQAGRDAHLMSTVLSAWTKFVNEQYILVRGPATGPAVRGSYKPLQAVLISCPPLVEEPPSVFLESARNKRCFVVGNCRKKRSIMRSVPHLPLRRPSIFIYIQTTQSRAT